MAEDQYDYRSDPKLQGIMDQIEATIDCAVEYVTFTEQHGISEYHPYQVNNGSMNMEMVGMDAMAMDANDRCMPIVGKAVFAVADLLNAINDIFPGDTPQSAAESWEDFYDGPTPSAVAAINSIDSAIAERLQSVPLDLPYEVQRQNLLEARDTLIAASPRQTDLEITLPSDRPLNPSDIKGDIRRAAGLANNCVFPTHHPALKPEEMAQDIKDTIAAFAEKTDAVLPLDPRMERILDSVVAKHAQGTGIISHSIQGLESCISPIAEYHLEGASLAPDARAELLETSLKAISREAEVPVPKQEAWRKHLDRPQGAATTKAHTPDTGTPSR